MSGGAIPMNARDVMSKPVVSVHPDTSFREIARMLLDKGISAVPVVDDKGAPIGMVSEADLIRPDRAAREACRDSWLEIFAEGEPLAPELLAWPAVLKPQRSCRHVSACCHGKRRYGSSPRLRACSSNQACAGRPGRPRHGHCRTGRSLTHFGLKQVRLVTCLIGTALRI
jgi:hypothetical protein